MFAAIDFGISTQLPRENPTLSNVNSLEGTKTHGMGLGLHLAKSALERINGTIAYQNRSQGGACFTVYLLSPKGKSDE